MTKRSWLAALTMMVLPVATLPIATVAAEPAAPQFKVDPYWPKPLPHNWIIGEIAGVMADSQDNIWIIQRPSTISPRETRLGKNPALQCCTPAPPVIEFSPAGDVIRAWGGPGEGY